MPGLTQQIDAFIKAFSLDTVPQVGIEAAKRGFAGCVTECSGDVFEIKADEFGMLLRGGLSVTTVDIGCAVAVGVLSPSSEGVDGGADE